MSRFYKEGDAVINYSVDHGKYDCVVYVWRLLKTWQGGRAIKSVGAWCPFAAYVSIPDAQDAFPKAVQFAGHTDPCECIGPYDRDCLACEHMCVECGESEPSDDDGRCEDCALNRSMASADMMHDQMKEGD